MTQHGNQNDCKHSLKRSILLTFILCTLFISSCTVDQPSPTPVDTATPPANVTAAPPTADTSWPTLVPSTANFDYYVLALSWAPNYCSANPNDTQECAPGRKYAFVLHGLGRNILQGIHPTATASLCPPRSKPSFQTCIPTINFSITNGASTALVRVFLPLLIWLLPNNSKIMFKFQQLTQHLPRLFVQQRMHSKRRLFRLTQLWT